MSVKEKSEFILNHFHPQAFLMFLHFSGGGLGFGERASTEGASSGLKSSDLSPGGDATSIHRLVGSYRPESVMSKIYNSRDSAGEKLIKAHFFNLETHKITALVPEIRFFLVQDDIYTPFFFPISSLGDEAATLQGRSRLKASGVKTFSVDFLGTDPFTAPRFLKADLQLYVDNLANIFDKQPGYARLADLFTISIARSAQKKEVNGATVTSGDLERPIEVAATLGYSIPPSSLSLFTQEEIREIQSSNLALRMNVIKHDIKVKQDGSAEINIEYTARINNTARDKIFSSTDTPTDLLKRANIRQLFSSEGKNTDSLDKKDKPETPGSSRRSQIQKALEIRKIMEILESKNKIHSLVTKTSDNDLKMLEYTVMGDTTATTPTEASTSLTGKSQEPPKDQIENENRKSEELTKMINDLDNSNRTINYVLFGDLIEAFFLKTKESLKESAQLLKKLPLIPKDIQDRDQQFRKALATSLKVTENEFKDLLAISKKSEDEKNKIIAVINGAIKKLTTFKVFMADIEYKHHTSSGDEEMARINIADIPVSLELYQEFMYDKIINSYRNTYTVPQFLNDCISTLLPNAFGRAWSNVGIAPQIISAPPSFVSATYTGPQLRSAIAKSADLDPEAVPSPQKDFRALGITDENDYFVIFQKVDRELASDRAGNEDKDSRDGIYHFLLGKNRGLIKEINFSRFDVPFAQEQLMTNQVGLYDELKMPYQASISMIGNNLFFPGSQIFINPNNIGFGSPTDTDSPAFKIGLGGYYSVLGVKTTFSNGVLSTDLDCSFGAPVGDQLGLSGVEMSPRTIDFINKVRPSNDAIPGDPAPLSTDLPNVSQVNYVNQLESLTDPLTGERVMDSTLARQISNDYILNQETTRSSIPGVIDKSKNINSGAVRYNLVRGEIVEIDDSRPQDKAVVLVIGRDVTGRLRGRG
jgi:hypothetical protein